MTAAGKAPWTIPVADGPVSVVADRVTAAVVAVAAGAVTYKLGSVAPDARGPPVSQVPHRTGVCACARAAPSPLPAPSPR